MKVLAVVLDRVEAKPQQHSEHVGDLNGRRRRRRRSPVSDEDMDLVGTAASGADTEAGNPRRRAGRANAGG